MWVTLNEFVSHVISTLGITNTAYVVLNQDADATISQFTIVVYCTSIFFLNLAFDFCRFYVVIRGFFIPATTANDLRLRRIFYPRFYPLHFISYINSSERTSISLLNVQC